MVEHQPPRRKWPLVSHYNIQRAIDIFGTVQDRDLGGVATDINRIVDKAREEAAARIVS